MKTLLMFMVIFIAAFTLVGCETVTAYYNPDAQQIITEDDWAALPPADQAKYEPVEVKQIPADTVAKIDSGLSATNSGYTIVKPFIPEPFATLGVLILGGITTLWQTYKKKQIQTRLDAVALGAKITASTVETVVKPVASVWEEFKTAQKAASMNTPAIMPDKVY